MKFDTTIRGKFKQLWKHYLVQSFLAAVVLLLLVLVLGAGRMVVISAMGATAFIVFATPKDYAAQTRNVVGGHLVGLAIGYIFCLTSLPPFIEYPLVVGIAVFVMVALDVEHPPAAGTALAVVINEVSPGVFVTIMISALVLSQCRYFLRNYLKDLL